jgi:hypothetical protein
MKNWMHTKGWAAQVWQEQDHQSHVKAYWNARFAAKAPKTTPKVFNPRGCYNSIPNWYERGFVSPIEARYPTFEENPAAYISGD